MTDKATQDRRPTTKDELLERINSDANWVAGALMALYQKQTMEEQAVKGTWHQNNAGFNAVDAGVLTDIAQYYERNGYLTDRQINFVRRLLRKYLAQLCGYDFGPLPIKSRHDTRQRNTQKLAELSKDGQSIEIWFPYSTDAVTKVKTLSGRSWDTTTKTWTANLYMGAVVRLLKWGFALGENLKRWHKETLNQDNVAVGPIPGLTGTLYPFQHKGVEFIQKQKGRVLLADEMGLGKTIQTLAWLQLNPKARPTVVVCPASLKSNWERETRRWTDIPVHILSGTTPETELLYSYQGSLFIINYDILDAWLPLFKKMRPKAVVLDECHFIKNKKAQRTKAARMLCKGAQHVIALSGTPIVNRPIEVFNAISLVSPFLFPNFWRFAQRYCGARHNGWGWDFTGATNTEELHNILTDTVMLRRLKREVFKELPEKTRSIIPLEIDNRRDYESAARDIVAWVAVNEGADKAEKASMAEVLVQFEKLKQLSVEGKLEQAKQWIRNFLESGEKLVVFFTHKKVLESIYNEFYMDYAPVKIDGSVAVTKRQEAVDTFQNDDRCRLFVGNIKAAGVGIGLSAASNLAFMELGWTPGEMVQAEDRIYGRVDNLHGANIYYLIAQNTVEEDIAALLDKKTKVLAKVLDGEDVKEDTLLIELIDRFKKGKEV